MDQLKSQVCIEILDTSDPFFVFYLNSIPVKLSANVLSSLFVYFLVNCC